MSYDHITFTNVACFQGDFITLIILITVFRRGSNEQCEKCVEPVYYSSGVLNHAKSFITIALMTGPRPIVLTILLGGNDYMSLAFISSQQSLGSLLYILIETLLRPMLIDAWMIINIVGPPPEIRRLLFNRRGELWMKMPVLALGDQSLDQPPK